MNEISDQTTRFPTRAGAVQNAQNNIHSYNRLSDSPDSGGGTSEKPHEILVGTIQGDSGTESEDLLLPAGRSEKNTPKGSRTPVLALRGLRPRPLDDGGVPFELNGVKGEVSSGQAPKSRAIQGKSDIRWSWRNRQNRSSDCEGDPWSTVRLDAS